LVEQVFAEQSPLQAIVKRLGNCRHLYHPGQVDEVQVQIVDGFFLAGLLGEQHGHRTTEWLEVLRVLAELMNDVRRHRPLAAETKARLLLPSSRTSFCLKIRSR